MSTENQKPKYPERQFQKWDNQAVKVYHLKDVPTTNTLIHGRVLINPTEQETIIVQNPPRGQRSVEIHRTNHARLVRRPDNNYTLTFRFDASEKYIKETLLSEIRAITDMATIDYNENKKRKAKQ